VKICSVRLSYLNFVELIYFSNNSRAEHIICDSRVQPWHGGRIKLAKLTELYFCNGSISLIEPLENKIRFKCCWLKGPETGLSPDDLGTEPRTDTNNTHSDDNYSTKRLIIICITVVVVIIIFCIFRFFFNFFSKS
jgi:hypothetical protein